MCRRRDKWLITIIHSLNYIYLSKDNNIIFFLQKLYLLMKVLQLYFLCELFKIADRVLRINTWENILYTYIFTGYENKTKQAHNLEITLNLRLDVDSTFIQHSVPVGIASLLSPETAVTISWNAAKGSNLCWGEQFLLLIMSAVNTLGISVWS
jgi:hypothetical protein